MQRTVADYKVLLKEYDLDVDFIEDYGKVKKVYTKTGVFALKEMANHQERNQNFIQKLQNVYQKGWMGFVPIYQTKRSQPIVSDESGSYYLMPWLPNNPTEERDIRYHKLFQELAKLHGASAQEVEVKKKI